MTLSFSHLGICVSDLEASVRFYVEGLGFEPVMSHRIGAEFGPLMEVDGVELESRMLARDGVTIELLGYVSPGILGDGSRRPMNQLGLTHLSLRVDDVDGVAATIEALGGTVVTATRTTFDLPGARLDFLYCTDPDGVRIELMDLPAGPADPVPSDTVKL
jgi:catechol 2,3-dioxygenase-like lactoylglutathione lyase family enzyme